MYYNKKIEEIEKELLTSNKGLSKDEVITRQQKYGKNTLPKKQKDSILKIFFSEFKDPMVILLLVAIVASIIAGEAVDAIAILFIVLIDAIMGAYQENKANNTAEALAKLVTTKVKVVRDDDVISIDAEDLTIGDYVLLESGDKISADMRIVEAHNLMIDESILTGESVQVNKNSPIISWRFEDANDSDSYVDKGILIDTYYCVKEQDIITVIPTFKNTNYNCPSE